LLPRSSAAHERQHFRLKRSTVPNAASAKLTEASIAIMQARAACADGRANDAVALYDRLIAELESEW
jgi:hypothetical protein